MFDIVLYQPEIPPNTGNVIRLCANTGCQLHLIEPLGFRLDDRQLRRAGLDYHEYTRVRVHPGWDAFLTAMGSSRRWFAFSARAGNRYDQAEFQAGDVLVFGPETIGLPEEVKTSVDTRRLLRLPMVPASRSLNLSNSVAAVVYEAWRQNGFRGAAS